MSQPLRIVPDEPFPEVGTAFHTALSDDGQWLAVVGYLGGAFSRSRVVDLPHGSRPAPRVLVYRRADLSYHRTVAVPGESVETLAFHPTLPLLAVGTDEGDEYARHGTLLLADVVTGRQARVVCADAGVAALRWRDGDTLDVLLAEADHDLASEGLIRYAESAVPRPPSGDWLTLGPEPAGATGSPDSREPAPLDARRPAAPDWESRLPEVAVQARHAELRELATADGRDWRARRAVWAVAGLRDGRVLAAREDNLLECWSPEGRRMWTVPPPAESFQYVGLQLQVTPDERTARVTVATGTSDDRRSTVLAVSLADGSVRTEHRLRYPALLTARADGVWAARDTCELFPAPPSWSPSATLLFAPDGTPLGAVPLGHYDPRTELTVRRAPDLYALVVRDRPAPPGTEADVTEAGISAGGSYAYAAEQARLARQETWLARVTPGERNAPGAVEPLFPLGPRTAVRGGPAVYVDDAAGPALILATADSGTPRLTRRSLPHGEPTWSLPTDSAIAGLDLHANTLYAATATGDLLTLSPTTGTLHAHHPLTSPGGHPFTPLTLTTTVAGDVVIGTLEGRLLVRGVSA
ncbi:hypothetical protein OYE22_12585 [Streptomyces sp. 71268]|uniref:hypothetical protein n=1 Tax=Streptomyces sp. 71268 TaxID=3002640 RepID=UPI0023F70E77|nr:hypothetical protein [Streptomyces sp. 71268]WEV25940.1 hypothetical protein OYE22_12585 [Streptomyces sp. 71268]